VEAIEQFLSFDYADEVMIALGAFLVFTGVTRIIKSSMTMIIWVALSGFGVASVSYGMNRSAIDLPFLSDPQAGLSELSDLASPGKSLSADALAVLCDRFYSAD
jgi:hypothetical protein